MSFSIKQPSLLSDAVLRLKQCTLCREFKSRSDFSPHRECKDGLLGRCRVCESNVRRERYKNLTPEQRETLKQSKRKSKQKYRTSPRGRLKERAQVIRAHSRAWYHDYLQSPAVKTYRRNIWLKHKFGITLEDYNQLLAEQDEKCAICGALEGMTDRRTVFDVDHDHVTGQVRGLLCNRCNIGIAKFGDSVELLSKAILYLERFKDATANSH